MEMAFPYINNATDEVIYRNISSEVILQPLNYSASNNISINDTKDAILDVSFDSSLVISDSNQTSSPILKDMHTFLSNAWMESNITSLEDMEDLNSTETYWDTGNYSNFSLYETHNVSATTPCDNSTTTEYSSEVQLLTMVILGGVLGLIILATVVGNVFVIAAIFLERNLQTVGNYLVLSLAVADLLVALLVMPMGALYEVHHEWVLGPVLCEVWTSGDVLCCTASILHLVAIALDRYWAVTDVDYVRRRSNTRIGLMIFMVWAVGVAVSSAPIFGWKDENFLDRIQNEKRCLVSQDAGYQIFATCSSFYVPLVIILILYWRIFQVARKRIRRKPGAIVQPADRMITKSSPSTQVTEITKITETTTNGITATEVTPPKTKKKRENMEAKRERKAAKTLAIITGVFVICWLPFFVTALLMAVCALCEPNPYLFSFFLWLGYINSMLNPIIYTIFSPDFRSAFKRVLCGKKRGYIR